VLCYGATTGHTLESHSGERRARGPGTPAPGTRPASRGSDRASLGKPAHRIRALRQHASIYVDLAEKDHTVDITNRGRLAAQLVPVREPGSPLQRLIAAGSSSRPRKQAASVTSARTRTALQAADRQQDPGAPSSRTRA